MIFKIFITFVELLACSEKAGVSYIDEEIVIDVDFLNSSKKGIFNNVKCLNNQLILPNGDKDGVCYQNGAISSEVPLCSVVGVDILKAGGNAIDAAIASTICVGIINAFSSGIGGGGFMLIRIPHPLGKDVVDMIDFRETCPSKLNNNSFVGKSEKTLKGGLAVGVPGEIKGLWEAHKKYGKMKWKNLFTKNIEIAKGFEVSDQLYARLKKLSSYIFSDPGLKSIYTRNGELVKPKDIISRDKYALTLQTISENPNDFYEGEIADKIIKSIKKEGGVMEKEDLENYKAIFRDVLKSTFMNYDLYTTNIPSSGLFIIEALNILEQIDVLDLKTKSEAVTGFKKYPHYHVLIEIFKFIAAKRAKIQDPDFMTNWKETVNEITDKLKAKEIAEKININKPLDDKEYGFEGIIKDDHGTTHLNIIDKDEMMVSITSTINLEFGAKFMCEETGIIMNNENGDFYVKNAKSSDNLAEMPENIILPNKRPFSSAAPFILSNHEEAVILGGAGGTRIPTSLVKIIFDLLLNKSLSEAIAEPRIHNQFYPHITYIEHNFPQEIRNYLEGIGHKLEISSQNSIFTSVQGIHMIKKLNGAKIIQAVSDKRKGGDSFGY